jgi:hypothetical protein
VCELFVIFAYVIFRPGHGGRRRHALKSSYS